MTQKIKHFVLAPTYFPRESIIGTTKLNFCVRNENRCDLGVEAPKQSVLFFIFKLILQKLKEEPERVDGIHTLGTSGKLRDFHSPPYLASSQ